MTPATDRLVSTEPLPRQTGLVLAIHYRPSPYGEAEEAVQHGLPSGYYTTVQDVQGRTLTEPMGPYMAVEEARKAALRMDAIAQPTTYADLLEAAQQGVWNYHAGYEERSWLGYDLPTEATLRYLQLRDLLALMEAKGDSIQQLVADALDDVAYLKGVSTRHETPAS